MSHPSRAPRSLLGPLWLQVLLGMALGVAIGILFPRQSIALKPLGDDFILLIRMTLAPIIFSTVAVGIARMGDLREAGRVGIKALVYFEVVSTVALAIGLIAIDLLHPGRGMNIEAAKLDPSAIAAFTSGAQHVGIVPFLTGILPTSVAEPFATGNILQVIFLGVLFGVALAPLRTVAKPLIDLLDLILRVMFGIVRIIMLFAPLAAFGAMAYTVGQYGVASLRPLAIFTAEQWAVSALFVAVVLGLIARANSFSLMRLLAYLREELLITGATSSSEAVLAPVMLKLEQLGCSEPVVGLVMPAGYTFNADGTAIYLSMGAIFLAQATNTHLGLREQITILLVLMLTSKGSAGVAGAGFITLAATLAAMHSIPAAALVLLLGVERITNIPRAVVNVIGSSVATIVIAKWENAFDASAASPSLHSSQKPAN
ncbi:MAG TPA: C4-dicarboxylate transporter DctA [Acidobacteriaceae bacterium]|nr:C4-dicarboxylate transporter DctA [Acidobacteriaceae bacterium]